VIGSIMAIPEIVRITLRQLIGRRRAVLLVLLAAVPILLALLFRAAKVEDVEGFSGGILDAVALTLLLPLVAILFGTAAFGAEIEDGTVVYLLAKPVARWAIVAAKLIATVGVTAALTASSVLLAGVIALMPLGESGAEATRAYVAAMIVGSACYASVFLAISLFTRRSLVVGIGYWLIWEGALSTLLPGIANLSVRQYALGIANAFFQMKPEEARLAPSTALPLVLILLAGAFVIATWRLTRFELTGSGD
jgi:ABC-2 type transport system permease protein